MTPEFGLFLLKTFLFFDALVYNSSPAKSDLIRRNGKQNEILSSSTLIARPSVTENLIEINSASSTPSSTYSSSLPQTSTASAKDFTTVNNSPESMPVEEIEKQISQQTEKQQQQQQQLQNPWNSIWNNFPIILPNWWQQSFSPPSSSASSTKIQTTPVASLTLTLGKTTYNKPIDSNVASISGSTGIGLFGCPPPIVISNVCPEKKCNCQCDNKNMNEIVKPTSDPTIKINKKSETEISSTGKPQQEQFKQAQNRNSNNNNQQDSPSKFILPFQSLHDFFLRPVQLISNRAKQSITSLANGDNNNVEPTKDKQSSKYQIC